MNSRYAYKERYYQQESKKTRLNLNLVSCQKNVNKARDLESSKLSWSCIDNANTKIAGPLLASIVIGA